MRARQVLDTEILPVATRLCRWRRAAEVATRVGLPATGALLVVLLWEGVGLLPSGAGLVAGGVAAGAVLLSSLIAALRIRHASDGLRSLGHENPLADAIRTAMDLGERADRQDDPVSVELMRAHLLRTAAALKRTPPAQVVGTPLLQRLQVMAVLCVCVVSVALL